MTEYGIGARELGYLPTLKPLPAGGNRARFQTETPPDGQRGIVVFETFNEGEETLTSGGKPKTIQWVVDPQDGRPRGFAFVWRRFDIPDLPQPMLAAVMCTVPANELLRRTFMANQDDPRMPAILDDADWATWLGENGATPEQAKTVLKTVEGVTWKAERAPTKPRAK